MSLEDGLYFLDMKKGNLSCERIVIRRPINDFKVTAACAAELTGVIGSAHYLRVCRPWPPYRGDLRKYNSATTATDIFGFPSTGISSGTITNVAIWILVLTTYGNSEAIGNAKTVLSVGGSAYEGDAVTSFRSQKNYDGSNYVPNLNYARPTWRKTDYAQDPYTAAAWTWATVNALNAGFKITGAASYSLTAVLECKAVITFTVNGIEKEVTIRPSSDVSVALTTNDNTSMAYAFLNGEIADSNIYAQTNATNYKTVLSAIRPIPHEAEEVLSVIIKHTAWKSSASYTGNSKAVLRTHGTEYYGTERALTTSPVEYTDTWTTNPATGLSWTREEANELCHGIAMKNSSTSGYSRCSQVYCKITYKVRLPGYSKIPGRLTSLKKNAQSPTITPDELAFLIMPDVPAPDYAEVILVNSGEHIFHGVITKREESGPLLKITCKAQQWLLDYRYIPDFAFLSDLRACGVYSSAKLYEDYHYPPCSYSDLNGLLSDEPPIECDNVAYYDSTHIMIYCVAGALFWINSCIPNGLWEAYSSTVAKLAGAGYGSAIGSHELYACASNPQSGEGAVDSYLIDGIKRLRMAANVAALSNNEYVRDSADLYIKFGDGSYWPNAFLVAAWNWCDTKIRLGTIDIGDWKSGTDLSLRGKASKSLQDLFEKLGKEIQFLPDQDGTVQFNAASEISRGSSTTPIKKFIHGTNCQVKFKGQTEPNCQACIGVKSGDTGVVQTPQLDTDWDVSLRPQLIKICEESDLSNEEMRAKIADVIANNDYSFEITSEDVDFCLRVGDHVWVTKEDVCTDYPQRIQKIEYTGYQSMKITTGKQAFTASDAFGQYLKLDIASDAEPVQETEIDGSTVTSFTIKKENARGDNGLVVIHELSFSFDSGDYSAGMDGFVETTLNGVVIPPGRMRISPDSSTIERDITDFCSMSESADTENAIETARFGYTGYSSMTEKVKQYRASQKCIEED